jgi:hypothetical protein
MLACSCGGAYRGLLGYNSVVRKAGPDVSEEHTNSIIRLAHFYLVVWVMTLCGGLERIYCLHISG